MATSDSIKGSGEGDVPFGELLRQLRDRRNLSQSECAQAIGKPQSMLSNWERGNQVPTSENLAAIARAMDVSVDVLLEAIRVQVTRQAITQAAQPSRKRRKAPETLGTDLGDQKTFDKTKAKTLPSPSPSELELADFFQRFLTLESWLGRADSDYVRLMQTVDMALTLLERQIRRGEPHANERGPVDPMDEPRPSPPPPPHGRTPGDSVVHEPPVGDAPSKVPSRRPPNG
jgi:transcriptional regulator with XRE-family HTH domain